MTNHPPWIDSVMLMRALRMATAAWLSFILASLLHVENAYWAAMPVWVIAQPSRSLLISRGGYRLLGTLAGALLGLAILHLPVPAPVQLSLACLCIGLSAGSAHLLPGVRAYGATMMAITTAVVVVPSALAPDASLHLALERMVCTVIGVVVSLLVLALWTPAAARQAFYASAIDLSTDALLMAARIITHPYSHTDGERRLLADISELEARSATMAANSRDAQWRQEHVNGAIVAALEVMSAAYAIAAQVRRGHALPQGLADDITHMAAYLQKLAPHPHTAPQSPSPTWLAQSASEQRLLQAVAHMAQEAQALLAAQRPPRQTPWPSGRLDAASDWTLAWQTALTATAACWLATYAVHHLQWPLAIPMAMSVCIFSIILSGLPMPQKAAPQLFMGVLVGVAAAIAYRLWVQPLASDTARLALSILPFLLMGAWARVHPRTAIPAIDANMCFLLASQAGHASAPLSTIFGESLGMVGAAGLIAACFVALPRLPQKRAISVARGIERDLQRLLTAPGEWQGKTNRQILRLMLHIGRASPVAGDVPRGLLAALNLGQAITALHQCAASGDAQAQQGLQAMQAFNQTPEAVQTQLLALARAPQCAPETTQWLEMACDALDYAKPVLQLGHTLR